MEFERAIYRVYDRCLDGLRDDDTDTANKYCRLVRVYVKFDFVMRLVFVVLYNFCFQHV